MHKLRLSTIKLRASNLLYYPVINNEMRKSRSIVNGTCWQLEAAQWLGESNTKPLFT